MTARAVAVLALAAGLGAAATPAAAAIGDSLRFCDRDLKLSAQDEDRLFSFGAIVKAALDRSGERVALIARSGLDLDRFGIRYSHAGLSLREDPEAPWSVRQLYYACDEGRPRLFDQGLSGFLLGTDDPHTGYLSVVFLPPAAAAQAETAARDNARALSLLAGTYSANAYAWSRRYQNCNQWLAELLATAWSGDGPAAGADGAGNLAAGDGADDAADGEGDAPATPVDPSLPPQAVHDTAPPPAPPDAAAPARARAQHWLRSQGYQAAAVEAGVLTPLATFIPYVHTDDHPRGELRRGRFVTHLPASIEAFVHATQPGARRMEFCHAGTRVVVHRGWDAIAPGCQPGPGDEVLSLE